MLRLIKRRLLVPSQLVLCLVARGKYVLCQADFASVEVLIYLLVKVFLVFGGLDAAVTHFDEAVVLNHEAADGGWGNLGLLAPQIARILLLQYRVCV